MTPESLVRRAAAAERLLLLIETPERVAAVIGDLVESAEAQSRWRFWRSVLGTAVSLLAAQIAGGGAALIGTALAGWFAFMAASVLLTVICMIVGAAGWAALSLVPGLMFDLPLDPFRLRVQWPPLLSFPVFWMQVLPILTIRVGARWWPGRELPLAVVCAFVWAVLATAVPLVIVPGVWRPAPGVEIPLGTSNSTLGIVLVSIFTLWGGVSAAAERIHRSPA